jgi:hypothetical protein
MMVSVNTNIADVHKRRHIINSKVNIRQYLTNKKEPAEMISDVMPGNIDRQSGIIKDASSGRKAFRRLALTLRFGYKV